jgi:hypothetical protein
MSHPDRHLCHASSPLTPREIATTQNLQPIRNLKCTAERIAEWIGDRGRVAMAKPSRGTPKGGTTISRLAYAGLPTEKPRFAIQAEVLIQTG